MTPIFAKIGQKPKKNTPKTFYKTVHTYVHKYKNFLFAKIGVTFDMEGMMQDEWIRLGKYPPYSISQSGLIRNDSTGLLLKRSRLGSGNPAVSLYVDGKYIRRQVSSFMAETWLEPHPNENFKTIIHLDGDRDNCHVDNLRLGPRWFAIQYHKDCREDYFPDWDRPFRIIETGEIFTSPFECARSMGVLQTDVMVAVLSQRPIYQGMTPEFL